MGAHLGWDLAATDSGFEARNIESAVGEEPKLLTVARLGNQLNPSDPAAYQRVVRRLSPYDGIGPGPGSWEDAVRLQHASSERYPEEVMGALSGFRALVMSADSASALPGLLASALAGMTASRFPDARLYLIESTERLSRRYGVARAMLHVGDQPPEPATTGEVFSSSLYLMADVNVGLAAYLEPLVTSLSPHVWAMTAPRVGGVIVLLFGQPVSSATLMNLDLLSLSERTALLAPLRRVESVTVEAYTAALRWWVSRLDLVFSHLTEPSNHVKDGSYHPPTAVERMLAFEQFCRSVQTIGSSRDTHARRLTLFHALDSLHGLNPTLTFERATTLSKMEPVLDELRKLIPAEAQPVLLPRAATAVDALRDVQNGFFMATRLRDGYLSLPNKNGVGPDAPVPLANAAREWLRVLRNSQHGLDKAPDPRQRALLAAHTGDLSPRISDLAYLALLEILARPELLRGRHRNSQRRQPLR
ncbi:hypothetical protein [Curtobacterium ammoniigenes]|uniref:hypothetical protein n=1 Tax=Curtobacterium ammoniigenes TaxID=395387 RepID=UPI000ADBF7C0|nr:hypothetical protein [Curtobacterium ammoniigenes]